MTNSIDKISIALPPEMTGMMREALNTGDYASTSEIVREALRLWKRQRQIEQMELDQLRIEVMKGINSPTAGTVEEVAAEVHALLRREFPHDTWDEEQKSNEQVLMDEKA
jgi:antitoxin ParD1/3/4